MNYVQKWMHNWPRHHNWWHTPAMSSQYHRHMQIPSHLHWRSVMKNPSNGLTFTSGGSFRLHGFANIFLNFYRSEQLNLEPLQRRRDVWRWKSAVWRLPNTPSLRTLLFPNLYVQLRKYSSKRKHVWCSVIENGGTKNPKSLNPQPAICPFCLES